MASTSTLTLYDTLSRAPQPVHATDGGPFRFYCCGPTVYGPAHIGNFRTFLVQDLFRRVVELTGLPTRHVRNVTDVDDKTIRESLREGKSLGEFTAYWKTRFHADADALNILPPHVEPGAVDHIPEQVSMISTLLEKGLAYTSDDGSVYFKVSAYPAYGRLSGVQDRELKPGAAPSANDADEYDKDDLADFALWKTRKDEDGENFWSSPWGDGRPGWHLECSAMGHKYLGESFDLHSGGIDLCFPHHENEIAQSEGATGKTFARHWFHIAHLMVDGQKMSKSLGNLYTLTDIQEKGYTPAELRFALLAGHYRQPLNFTFDSLHSARQNLERLAKAAGALATAAGTAVGPSNFDRLGNSGPGVFTPAWETLLKDINTAGAIGKIFTTLKKIEKELVSGTLSKEKAGAYLAGLNFITEAFGWIIPELATGGEIPAEIQELARRRWDAKQSKDWAASDALRDELTAAGWQINDTSDSYTVEKI